MVIAGAAISAGTDPEGNFSLDSILVGTEETTSVGGALTEIAIPAGASYTFKVSYSPKTSGSHSAVIDVAYRAPEIQVDEFQLGGESVEGETKCVSLNEGSKVNFDGNLILTVSRLVAATSKLSAALSSDDGIEALTPVPLDITLDLKGGTATLPEIAPADNFILPLPGPAVPVLGGCLKTDTVITSTREATGTYDSSVGSITLNDVVVSLDSDFNTTITVTLTTDDVSLTNLATPINTQAIQAFGTAHFDSVGKKILGSRIDAETGKLAFVGTSVIESSTLDPGGCDLTKPSAMKGATMAILIEGSLATPAAL